MKFDRIISHSYDLMVMAMTWCVLVTTWAILTFGALDVYILDNKCLIGRSGGLYFCWVHFI
jgi:hypothetical protein